MDSFPDFIRNLPAAEVPIGGATGYLLQGETQQVIFLEFDRDTEVPEHSHRAQWEVVVAGKVTLRMEGRESARHAGESFFIPAGVVHSATVHAGYRAIVFFDQVDRYRTKPTRRA
jgi:quercetin dioxygenase-like cupin family protein